MGIRKGNRDTKVVFPELGSFISRTVLGAFRIKKYFQSSFRCKLLQNFFSDFFPCNGTLIYWRVWKALLFETLPQVFRMLFDPSFLRPRRRKLSLHCCASCMYFIYFSLFWISADSVGSGTNSSIVFLASWKMGEVTRKPYQFIK